ncbi:MAG: polysaccharide pyruvyl transferase family protein [Fimbriimonadales bacterium]|nr:polysaccharide pyruvyl transferase family protein [Fimbriimonadales bacterium]
MTITVVNYTGNRSNWGSQATSAELLKQLEEVCGAVSFHLVPLRKSRMIDGYVGKVFGRPIMKALANSTAQGDRLLLRMSRLLFAEDFDRAMESDCVVFQPEGTMDGLKFSSGARLLLLPTALSAAKKQVLCLNGSAESFSEAFERCIAGAFSRYSHVATREPVSAKYLERLGVKNVDVIPDMAFMTEPASELSFNCLSNFAGRDYLVAAGSAILRQVPWREHFRVINEIANEHKLGVVWLTAAPATEKTIGRLLETHAYPNIVRIPKSATYQEVARVIADARFVIGGRYHMNIIAAALGTPFVPMPSGSHKTEGLLQLLDYPIDVVRFEDTARLAEVSSQVLGDRDQLSKKLRNETEALRRTIEQKMEALRPALLGRIGEQL